MDHQKDYSEYELTPFDKYQIRRKRRKDIILNYFHNKVRFDPENRMIRVFVDDEHEDYSMEDMITEYYEDLEKRTGVHINNEPLDDEDRKDEINKAQEWYAKLQKKYQIERISDYDDPDDYSDTPEEQSEEDDFEHPIRHPMNDVLSGTFIQFHYGEGILDFVYADLVTPMKEMHALFRMFRAMRDRDAKNSDGQENEPAEESKEKVYNITQDIVERYFDFVSTCGRLEESLYASLYSAMFPPCFIGYEQDTDKKFEQYAGYLLTLQKEYRELLEFCYDENFYPDVLGNLYPSERYRIYRRIHDLPNEFDRREELTISYSTTGGPKHMPFGMPKDEYLKRIMYAFSKGLYLNDAEKGFAEKYGLEEANLAMLLHRPSFMSIQYDVSTAAEMLELEFTKMLEENIRFRKCKRCGKYFIMKGNYDTNYCDRIADGSTRTCQELAAIENYKTKTADNKAIALYNKYYKRYSARVKVRQIKEGDFKAWKYQALTKRNECIDGKITVEEYETWLDASFANRKKKN